MNRKARTPMGEDNVINMSGERKSGSPVPSSRSAHSNRDDFEIPVPAIPEPNEPGAVQSSDNPFDDVAVSNATRVKQVWAVGGGKGGVGKSLVAANLAIALARLNHRVVAIDLDLGAANLHTALGINPPRLTLGDFVGQRVNHLEECVFETSIQNLGIVSGAQDGVGNVEIPLREKSKMLQQIRELDADYVLVDLGAGTGKNTIDFFLSADVGVMTLLPEPTSIENAYRFIKSMYFRRLLLSPKLANVRHLIESAMDGKNDQGIRTPTDLLRHVSETDSEAGIIMKAEIAKLSPKLVVNQVRTQTDIDIGFSVKSVCRKYFGIEMDYVGYLDYDSSVWQAVRRKRPLILEFPNSRLVSNLERITKYLLKRHGTQRSSVF